MNKLSKSKNINREALQNWHVASMARERDGSNAIVANEEQLLRSRRDMIPDESNCNDLWVFAYGSLIYNPIISYEKCLIARTHGYHRRLGLWTKIGRGSPEYPGLVLALDYGGSCVGVGYQLNPDVAIAELDLLWRREMLTLSYNARWLKIHTSEGVKRGLGFVSNPQSAAYAPPMPFNDTVNIIATAHGFNGHCYDYLFDTIAGMKEFGIRDAILEKLALAVSEKLASTK